MSGVIGPWLTALAARRSDRQRFELDRASARRDDLRDLLDEAAALLAPGASNIRELHDAQASGANRPDLDAWSKQTFTMGQRIRLRLTESEPVVAGYDSALEALVEIPDPAGDQGRYDATVAAFEHARSRFLTASRDALQAPVKAARA